MKFGFGIPLTTISGTSPAEYTSTVPTPKMRSVNDCCVRIVRTLLMLIARRSLLSNPFSCLIRLSSTSSFEALVERYQNRSIKIPSPKAGIRKGCSGEEQGLVLEHLGVLAVEGAHWPFS